jgi:hypothetical protein
MASSTMSGGDSVLVSQCLDFCQALAIMEQTISFSLTLGSTYSFNLDTRKKDTSPGEKVIQKKKQSPSTIRRNHRRKEEFLKKKRETTSDMDSTSVLEDTFQCEHCANSFKTENGLKIHIGKSHKALKLNLSLEKVRDHLQDTSLTLSPVRDNIREEIGTEEEKKALTVPEESNAHKKESQTDLFLRVDEKNYPTGPSLDLIYDEPPASVYHPTWGVGKYESTETYTDWRTKKPGKTYTNVFQKRHFF